MYIYALYYNIEKSYLNAVSAYLLLLSSVEIHFDKSSNSIKMSKQQKYSYMVSHMMSFKKYRGKLCNGILNFIILFCSV